MNHRNPIVLVALLTLVFCVADGASAEGADEHGAHEEAEKGPHGGRLLEDDGFAIELTIFERGVDPEFRAYAFLDGEPVEPSTVSLAVELERLGGRVDRFTFAPREDYLVGDGVVREPHSFVVTVAANHAGSDHRWTYESFEGRTTIAAAAAAASGVVSETAGPATIHRTLTLHGVVVPDPARVVELRARFPGVVREVRKRIGDRVAAGETVAVIEANESLQRYNLVAPGAGVVVSRSVNPGMIAADGTLLTVADLSTVWVELAAFQHDLEHVQAGQVVAVRDVDGHQLGSGVVDTVAPVASPASQSMTVRVSMPNDTGLWRPGLFVTGEITVEETEVPLAVRRDALQPFRDWTVVFEQVGDVYEIRPLRTGRSDRDRVEVLEGLEPGAHYVTNGSFLVKADIEKSGASHDH